MDRDYDVELVDVAKRYGPAIAVEGVSLRVPRASYCCLLGPSGCGKTTTLRMIAGHEAPSEGDVLIHGQNVTDLPPGRRGTAMMFQSYALFPHLTCLDNVAFPLKVRGVRKADRRARGREHAGTIGRPRLDPGRRVPVFPRVGTSRCPSPHTPCASRYVPVHESARRCASRYVPVHESAPRAREVPRCGARAATRHRVGR